MIQSFLYIISFIVTGIYSFSVESIDHTVINFSDFAGKKILIVNTATNDKYVSQYGDLETLYQQNKGSLIIIAFPSNSFNGETADSKEIKDFVQSRYHIHYLLASKIQVAGPGQHPLFGWLADQNKNGYMNNSIKKNFQKFLIDGSGRLVGVFAPSVNPLSPELTNAIKSN